ncbi:MAG: MATE family efflux transporter [Candidatus Cryptobacteroides sp.]
MKKINSEILSLAIPSILANITVPLVGMVDIAVAGNLDSDSAPLIGGIAIGSMLFDLLYWNFAFLRVSTGGLTAQAYGRADYAEAMKVFVRAVGIALVSAAVLIAIHRIFVGAAFLVVDSSPQVRELASLYFNIRIWAAPATLSLMAFKGWFIGMQDSLSAMVTDVVVNGVNMAGSIVLAMGLPFAGYEGMGFRGIAAGTVLAQYSGLLAAVVLCAVRYRRQFALLRGMDLVGIFKGGETRKFFVMNVDLVVRSLCFIGIYIGFTTISAGFGDLLLATGSIMMKLLLLFSYFTDGFAYAGEAMTGKYIGAGDRSGLMATVKWTFVWSMSIAVGFIFIYWAGGRWMLGLMTGDRAVLEVAVGFLPWLLLMPLVGCPAFTWDGICIGATATRQMRNSTLWAVAAFFAVYYIGSFLLTLLEPVLSTSPDLSAFLPSSSAPDPSASPAGHSQTPSDLLSMHILMSAYFAHLLARTIYLTLHRRTILQ